jgi:hypothetical protein
MNDGMDGTRRRFLAGVSASVLASQLDRSQPAEARAGGRTPVTALAARVQGELPSLGGATD